jgi:hypothetical protein
VVLAVVSDIHCGSTVAVCPPEGVKLDDGGAYKASRVQRWLWQCWEDYWKVVAETTKRERAELYVLFNGDLVEGDHHGTAQIISKNPEAQLYVAQRTLGIPQALKPKRRFVVRGTEAHVGGSGSNEEALARWLGAERDPETHLWSWWRLRLELHGVLIDCLHHGRAGQRPWTEQSVVAYLANQIFMEHARRKIRPPDLAVRSHFHRFADSYKAAPTRVIQTPAWQLKTAYAHKVVPESIADVGGVIITIHPDGRYQSQEVLFQADLPGIWAASA